MSPLAASSTSVQIAAIATPFITAIGVAYLSRKVLQVHVLVNNRATVQDARIKQLADALGEAGVKVPDVTEKTGAP